MMQTLKANRKLIFGVVFAALIVGLFYGLYGALSSFDYQDVRAKMQEVSSVSIFWALAFTLISYGLMSGYDWLGQIYVKQKVRFAKTLLVSFYAYTLGLNVGFSLLSSSAVRYKLYSSWGYKPGDVARLIAFTSASFWIGLASLAGVALVFASMPLGGVYPIPDYLLKPVGGLFVLGTCFYLYACKRGMGTLKIFKWELGVPSFRLGVGQICFTGLDVLAAAAALFVLIPDPDLGFATFLGIYCIAFFGGIASNSPGGLGVFETVFVLFLPTSASGNELLATLVLYRAIYYGVPLLLAGALFASMEGPRFARAFGVKFSKMHDWMSAIAPRIMSAIIFAGGAVLLATGSLPSPESNIDWLEELLPLPVVEISHFLGSVLGLLLLFLAFGIKRKLDSAYYLTIVSLLAAAPVSMMRGDGIVPCAILLAMAGVLAPCRKYFYRKSSLLNLRMGMGSVVAILVAVGSSIYLGLFAYQNAEYADMLWWRFSFEADVPRFLRASLGVTLLVACFSLYKIINAPKTDEGIGYEECEELVDRILESSSTASSNLALMGDKRFLFSGAEDAFIMFRRNGRTWVAMGDPVGNEGSYKELVCRFRELCDTYSGIPVFYQASKAFLHNYIEVGLKPVKVGEMARVSVKEFTMEGSHRQSMRRRLKKASKAGCCFEILDTKESLLEMSRLREISDEWLEDRKAKEKGFSLGCFDERYLSHFRFAVVKDAGGKIVAFANLWETFGRKELAIDLMRYGKEAPQSVMEFLFVELIAWAKEEGFEWFDMRVAPLSGIAASKSSPLSSKLFDCIYQYGESFYKFRGLRSYKERFDPEWMPLYLASPGGLRLPRVTADVAKVVSRAPAKARREPAKSLFAEKP